MHGTEQECAGDCSVYCILTDKQGVSTDFEVFPAQAVKNHLCIRLCG